MALSAAAAEPARVVLDVPGMNCSLCPISVKKALDRAVTHAGYPATVRKP